MSLQSGFIHTDWWSCIYMYIYTVIFYPDRSVQNHNLPQVILVSYIPDWLVNPVCVSRTIRLCPHYPVLSRLTGGFYLYVYNHYFVLPGLTSSKPKKPPARCTSFLHPRLVGFSGLPDWLVDPVCVSRTIRAYHHYLVLSGLSGGLTNMLIYIYIYIYSLSGFIQFETTTDRKFIQVSYIPVRLQGWHSV